MPLTWTRTADQYPKAGRERVDEDWVAIERGVVIGRIQRLRDGFWQWNVTGAALAPHGLKQSGVEPSQREAAEALRDAWRGRPIGASFVWA